MNKHLKSLKDYLGTPAGCLGGNIGGDFWLFGIEYGGKAKVSDYQNLITPRGHEALTTSEMVDLLYDSRTSYYQNIAKLLSVVYGGSHSDYEKFTKEKSLGACEGQFYFGNIGSVGFGAEYNPEEFEPIGKFLGVESKDQLKAIETECRAGLFQSWVKQHNPKCILCFGIGNANRFVQVFSGEKEKPSGWLKVGRNNYYHDVINNGRTNLFVLPHPSQSGPWCLTTDERIKNFGIVIRDILLSDGFTPLHISI